MCGIFGYLGTNNLIINKNILEHRGPDDWGVINSQLGNTKVTLFQSRLSIIGLGEQGHQPFQKYTGKVLVFNGEIYNYLTIKKNLIHDFNIEFITETDTEVLYEAIVNYGINKTLEFLNGMFAFAFYDENSKNILLVRDNLGVKPLYYSQQENNFIFSSEIKSFFELNLRKPELNKDYLGEYFANGWIYEPNTLFKNIYKVQSGHFLEFDIPTVTLKSKKYWDIADNSINLTSPNIEDIVNSQMISDVPIGNYFSGGIDSSIITYLLKDKEILNINLSMGDSESLRVNLMQKAYSIPVEKIKYQNENLEIYKKLIYHLDEPMADPAIIPAFLLAKKSREMGRVVMMSGMGGDEIDAGYPRSALLSNKFLINLARFTPKFLIRKVFKGKRQRDILRLIEFANDISPANYFNLTSYFSKTEISSMLKSNDWFIDYRDKINGICKHIPGKKKYFYLDFVGNLSSHNLLYMDKSSMAASVEVRVPYLDKDLAKYFFKDIDKKENAGKTRLKYYLKSLLLSNYQDIKKAGFRYEINNWILNDIDWNSILHYFEKTDLINTELFKSYILERQNNIDNVAMKLWSIYTLYIWIEVFDIK